MEAITVLLVGALAVLCLLIMWREGLIYKTRSLVLAAILLGVSFAIRAVCLPHMSGDYNSFLSPWVDTIRAGGGFSALSESIGNYNLPYIYVLAAISYIDGEPLYFIKLFSIAFEVMLAWSVMKLVGHISNKNSSKSVAFVGTLLLPTVILNGSYWGQCDVVYSALAVLSVYLALRGRPWMSVICITLSFSFKLQAIFIIPIFLVFLFSKKIMLRHLLAFPATYVVTTLPAVIAGRPFIDTLLLYFNQVDSIGSALNYNSSSIFSILNSFDLTRGLISDNQASVTSLAIAVAALFMIFTLVYLFFKRRQLSDIALIAAALVFVIGIPYLLPRMHDRYFFLADVLSFALVVILPRYIPTAVLCNFASCVAYNMYFSYYSYQSVNALYIPMMCGGYALAFALVLSIVCLVSHVSRRGTASNSAKSQFQY